jgi:Cu(I)/Ag(I) efflux system membrane fusion protein
MVRKEIGMTITELDRKKAYRTIGFVAAIALAFGAGLLLRGGGGDGEATNGDPMAEAMAPKTAQWWTCSMHPHIKLQSPGKCPICFMDLIPLDLGGDDDEGGLRELSVSENSAKLMEIETAPVVRRFATTEVRMVGKIDYDETRVSYITAWVPGRLDRLFVDYTGVPVKKGDHMVYLYSPELLSAQAELLRAIEATKELGRSDVSIVRDTTEATVEATREKLRLWGLTADQIEEIEQRGKPDNHMTIFAPAGGIVIHKNAQEGMYVNTGTRIYTIADLSRLWVNLDAYESDLEWLRYGQRVSFSAESYPGEVFTGTISFIHPVLNEATRTVKVRVNVSNDDGRLKPGMFVRAVAEAEVATGGRIMNADLAGKWISPMHPEIVKDGPGTCDVCGMPLVRAESLGYVGAAPADEDKPLVIPATAALLTGKRAIVYVQVPDKDTPTFEGREIVLGPRAGDYYLVKRGLAVGERVVTKGNFKLDAELQIRAKPSMMTPEGGGGGGMAGMDHGETAMQSADQPMAAMAESLPAIAEAQLHEVISAAMAAVRSSPAELEGLHAAYRALQDRVASVSADALSGHARMQWNEYSMLLGNDGAEGASAQTAAEATRLAATTRQHVESMRAKLGLMTHGDPSVPASSVVNPEFRRQLAAVTERYMEIQTALAEDDANSAVAAARAGIDALSAVDMSLVSGQDHMDWMKLQGELKPLLSRLAEAGGIEDARTQFALTSEVLTGLIARFHPMKAPTYRFKCPMAFDGRGAIWLQSDTDTRNPYFGSAMLKCGEVAEVIPAIEDEDGNRHD